MPRLAPAPDNPFNDPDPQGFFGCAIRWPFRVLLVALSILAFAGYLLLSLDD